MGLKDPYKIQIDDVLYEINSDRTVIPWRIMDIFFEKYWDGYKTICKLKRDDVDGVWTERFANDVCSKFYKDRNDVNVLLAFDKALKK